MSANSDYDIMGEKLKNHAQVIVEKLHPSCSLRQLKNITVWSKNAKQGTCQKTAMSYTHVVSVLQLLRGKIFLMTQLLQLSTSLSYFKTLTQSCQIPDDGKANINTDILVVSFWTKTWEISLKIIILRILDNCIVCKNSAESFYRVSWNKHNILALLKWYLINLTIFLRHHTFSI